MIRHVVWWTLKKYAEGRSDAENARYIEQASAMLRGMPNVLSIEVSAKVQPSATVPAQVVLMSSHKDMADLEAYKANPVHMQFAEKISAVSDSRNCIDYAVD